MLKPLNFKSTETGEIVVEGVLDRHTVPSANFTYYTEFQQGQTLVLDLTDVSKVDTAGLAWLIDLLSQLQQKGIHLKLHNSPEQLTKLIGLGHVENLFE